MDSITPNPRAITLVFATRRTDDARTVDRSWVKDGPHQGMDEDDVREVEVLCNGKNILLDIHYGFH
jgi:hypothetical protein